ncbi:tRNA synthetases class I, catalytic domain-containing protein [Lipomyces orientalis]|uniref:tRNA synthetases class I, catalytic domain-containing protein n=1 Tax=Lipomyces orientalis TaxID=1233043 RepID=A0ACC3TMR5_9ASCO
MSDENDIATKLEFLGLTDQNLSDVLRNKKFAFTLASIVQESGIEAPIEDKTSASLLQSLGTATKDIAYSSVLAARSLVTDAIIAKKIKSSIQLEAAVAYIKSAGEKASSAGLEFAAGVGMEATPEQINKEVAMYFTDNMDSIAANRYKSVPSLMAGIKKLPGLKWAPPAEVKKAIDAKLLDVLGPKDERDAPQKKAKKDKTASAAIAADEVSKNVRNMFTEGFLGDLHKPGGNAQIKTELMEEHLRATGGIVVTRFPPEPNGYLHIGHSKAIAVNFGYAKYHNGICYLRYDDTNPEAEEERYFTAILEIVKWLGFQPYKITYSSDHFQRLYDLGEELIRRDKGYVCFCTPEEVHANRGGDNGGARIPCKHRSKPTQQSLEEFRAMRDGKYNPGEATLRMKMDLEDPNPQMWDLVAYRVLDAPHHRTGDTWKIYPTYDFTHCLCDSFENISHSLCTTEFYLSRQSYEWLCDALEIYKPAQREYGRLNITGTIMSKRKIARLVKEGYVNDWDDPRLFTLVAIRRRGVPPEAILSFVNELGVTTSNSNIQAARFEASIRRYLEDHTPRLMLIADPVLVILENVADDFVEEIALPYKPGSPELGEHNVPFTKRVYIDRSDFREQDSADYFRLAPGKSVGLLKVPYTVRVTTFTKDESGKVTEIRAIYENDKKIKPKTYIQWVADSPVHSSPVKISEVRMFNRLFLSENPESNPDGFLADINPNSLDLFKDALIEVGFDDFRRKNVKEGSGPESMRFQALRVGYFCIDRETTEESVILNRIVTLKEDAGKSSA